MKKRILGTLMAAALLVGTVCTAFAAPSRTSNAAVTGESAQYFQISTVFTDDGNYGEGVLDAIEAINQGDAGLEAVAALAPELDLEGFEMATGFQNLELKEGEIPVNENGKYEPTIVAPNLTEAMEDVTVLHYSTKRDVWELITPKEVDVEAKEITAEFEDLSPISVLYKTK